MSITILSFNSYLYGFEVNKHKISFFNQALNSIKDLKTNQFLRPMQSIPLLITLYKNNKKIDLEFLSEETISVLYSSLASVFNGFEKTCYQFRITEDIYADIFLQYSSLYLPYLQKPLVITGERNGIEWRTHVEISINENEFSSLTPQERLLVNKNYIEPIIKHINTHQPISQPNKFEICLNKLHTTVLYFASLEKK